MVSANLPAEFGSHPITPDQIFLELEWADHGQLGRELVQIFRDLTARDTWVAIRDNGDFTSCHNSIRGDWKEDTTCTIVLIAETADDLGRVSSCSRLAFYSEAEWSRQVERFLAAQREKRQQDPRAVAEGKMPERDPVIGVKCVTGVERVWGDNEFWLLRGNPQFEHLLQQVRDRLIVAGYTEMQAGA